MDEQSGKPLRSPLLPTGGMFEQKKAHRQADLDLLHIHPRLRRQLRSVPYLVVDNTNIVLAQALDLSRGHNASDQCAD